MVDYVKFLLRDAMYLEFFTDSLLKEYRSTFYLSKFLTNWSSSLDFVGIGCSKNCSSNLKIQGFSSFMFHIHELSFYKTVSNKGYRSISDQESKHFVQGAV